MLLKLLSRQRQERSLEKRKNFVYPPPRPLVCWTQALGRKLHKLLDIKYHQFLNILKMLLVQWFSKTLMK